MELDDSEFAFRQSLALGDFVLTSPFPCWCKDYTDRENPVMLWISRSYEGVFNVSRARYEGRPDKDVWSDDIAARFLENDLRAIEDGMFSTIEETNKSHDPKWDNVLVTKWCVEEIHFGETFTFVYGIAGPCEQQ